MSDTVRDWPMNRVLRLLAHAGALYDLARRYASECPRCTGEGALRSGGPPCDECADIRAVLDAIDRPEVTP